MCLPIDNNYVIIILNLFFMESLIADLFISGHKDFEAPKIDFI